MEAHRPSQSERRVVRLDVPCEPQSAALLRLAAGGLAVYVDFSTALLDDLKLAVTEAIRHAVATAREASRLTFVFEVASDGISIDVSADAPHDVPSPDDAEVSLFVLRALVDDVSIGGSDRYHLKLTKSLG